ncbi:hypothetical protein ACHAWF_014635 [Thalassiosira exigua]
MFSICEEPVVISGKRGEEEAMVFFWKGDGLWTKTGKAPEGMVRRRGRDDEEWTSFILPSRDPYPLPDLVEFGQFLAASLTFTQCLRTIQVYVNDTLQLNVEKSILESHAIKTPKSSSWWKNDGATTSSSTGMFTLGKGSELTQTSVEMKVSLRKSLSASEMETSTVRARYASAGVKTSIPAGIEKRMVRVTKKKPPKELTVQIFLDAVNHEEEEDGDVGGGKGKPSSKLKLKKHSKQNRAAQITSSFAPAPGSGRVFIGFRTSQTTGLGIHIAAPLMPTVEREAIDFVDAALREYNSELLEIGGVLMRLALEHEMGRIGVSWELHTSRLKREQWEARWDEEKKMMKLKAQEERDDASQATKDTASSAKKEETVGSSLFSFAAFMGRGIKNTVAEAIKAVPEILVGEDDESAELLNPTDDRPLSPEERDAILLMRAYCPRQSTPDSLVGQCLARGFARCLPSSSPPALTAGGVFRGNEARLPNRGMEAFGFDNVVRRIVLENAREYHAHVAGVPTLGVDDLVRSLRGQVLEEKTLVRLLKWWPRACRAEASMEGYGARIKDAVRFEVGGAEGDEGEAASDRKVALDRSSSAASDEVQVACVIRLDSILYYTPERLADLPLPETAFPLHLQSEVGLGALENKVFRQWFSSLPFDIWTSFVSQHSCLKEGRPEDANVSVLVALSKYYDSLEGMGAKRRFLELVGSPRIPYDDDNANGRSESHETQTAAPKELYLSSSDLTAFAGLGVFRKASKRLSKAGVSDTFLLALGVRTTISIDFLFLHLDTLRWNTNPKPLIKYLLEADLSNGDLLKLRSTQYLPAENDQSHVYAPSELYLKDDDLKTFPFVKFLQWPATEGMPRAHRDFLIRLGVRVNPPLAKVMGFLEEEGKNADGVRDEVVYASALQYLTQRLGPQGLYEKDFGRFRSTKFLPCIRQNLETGLILKEMQSPASCYYNPSSLVMGFSTLDPQLDTLHIATRTNCLKDPSAGPCIKRLVQLVDISAAKLDYFEKNPGTGDERKELTEKILTLFEAVFAYLASRASDFQKRDLSPLSNKPFVPCETRGQVVFYLPSQIFFKKESSAASKDNHDALTETLFQQTKYNAFLSLAGVKTEPSLQEIFDLMIEKPDEVLDSLGEPKYKMLLRRIASDPPFKHITKQMRSCPFLLGYLVIDEEVTEAGNGDEDKEKGQNAQYVLSRAEDIYIVDNSFLRRQFPMLVAPMEQALEEFYAKVGSRYVSEVVKKDFEVQGTTARDTPLTRSFARRIRERRPLLLSPTNSSRPLASNAAKVLDDSNLEIIQALRIQARYSFERSTKHLKVTCCSKQGTRRKTALYLTTDPDWFDIGSAIGALILQRCQLEDALLLSQLLESPLETLRYRGFPVDRILRPVSKPPPVPAEPQPPVAAPAEASDSPAVPHTEANGSVARGKHPESTEPAPQPGTNDGFETILKQMFPTCSSDTIQGLLGPNPSKDKVREVANMLAAEGPPPGDEKKMQEEMAGQMQMQNGADGKDFPSQIGLGGNTDVDHKINEAKGDLKADNKKGSKKKSGFMGKMLRGFHHGTGSGASAGGKGIVNQTHTATPNFNTDRNKPTSPENDASTQQSLEAMLSQAVQSSRSVDNAGVRSQETQVNHLPQGLERGSEGCEVISGQNLRPFKGPHGDYKSRNGIRVFSAAKEAPDFLSQNFDAVERFSVVIQHLATVYKLHLRTVAVYYEPSGNTIAFNSNRALYFNLRFFCALHQTRVDGACYSYWYMTFAHELAHNLVTAHNKEHGSFTESIAALYLPDFVKLLTQIS